jgi:hypothetical protein
MPQREASRPIYEKQTQSMGERSIVMKTSNIVSQSASHQRIEESHVETADSRWKPLYRVGGAAALTIVVLFVIQIIVLVASPPPSTVIGYFTLFHKNALLGLLDLDLLSIADYALMGLMFLALYVALRRASPSFMAIALTLGLVGIAAYFASNTAFNMLSLSNQYAAATTDAQRSLFLAAGQAMLAIYQGTAFYVSYVLVSVAPLIISVVMLRSTLFGKVTAYVGIVANVIGLGFFVPAIGVFLSLISVVGLQIWYILIARRLFMLAQGVSNEEAKRN